MLPHIVDAIDFHKEAYALLGFNLFAAAQSAQSSEINLFDDPTAELKAARMDGSSYGMPIQSLVPALLQAERVLGHARASLAHGVATVGDLLAEANLYDPASPELQFFRHLRNSVAHGNRVHFQGPEPRYPATFNQINFTIADQNAGPVLFDKVMPGDILDLYDWVRARP